ncbi:hypothetical protein LZC95_03355 [Pendulispora brunnea]|uniref:Uncharacterized protein n=1 Tax=Pendulispora brunnea TaxID=2905690 RepID=A0ABZ2KB23_9BACT
MRALSFGRPLFGAATLLALALAACASGSSSPPPATVDVPPAGSASSEAPATSAPAASGTASTSTPKQCGCSLCEPVVSEDACSTDADCAPSVPCHAPACVAKAKAVPRKPDTMCTMMMACTSADSNTCGCLKGKCALYPKSSP